MRSFNEKSVLVSGASIAGLSTALCMSRLGYKVTVVEMAGEPRTAGGAVDIKGVAVAVAKRIGIYEQLEANALHLERVEFKNADDETTNFFLVNSGQSAEPGEEIEIERDKFVRIMLDELKDRVEFLFDTSIVTITDAGVDMRVAFKTGPERNFGLVLGCDGIHSGVRRIWFGPESEYANFLGAYSSISILNKLLTKENTMQMYNVPDKAVMLNTYNGKTDVIFLFNSVKEIAYDYRDVEQQKKIIMEKFAGERWRVAELLDEVRWSQNFYFDKFCQIKMPSWTKGRVALVGDAGYCASPAAGMGASLALYGAGVLADALQKCSGNFELAFQEYNVRLRPFVEQVQAEARVNLQENFILRTEEAIRERNAAGFSV